MNKREKIILAVTLLLLVYLVYELLSGNLMSEYKKASSNKQITTQAKTAKKANSYEKILDDLQNNYNTELQLIKNGHITVKDNIFIQEALLATKNEVTETNEKQPDLTYSSYVYSPKRKIAVINNFEYTEGETIFSTQFILSKIEEQYIIVKSLKTLQEFKVPFISFK